MRLRYKAATKDGTIVNGIIDAKEPTDVASYLRSKDFLPIKIERMRGKNILGNLPFLKSIKANDLIIFTRQLSSMLSSGLTLMKGLEILHAQTTNKGMQEIISGIISDVEGGRNLSSSMSKFPETFDTIYLSVVKAGENSGLLDRVLSRLADNLEKKERLMSTIKGSLMYPAIVISLMFGVIIIMVAYVIPQLEGLFTSLNVTLPIYTRIILGISHFFVSYWFIILAVIAIGLFLFFRFRKTENGQFILDKFVLKLPIFGILTKDTMLAEFSRTFGLLIGTGTLVVDALNQTSGTTGNVHYRSAILGIAKQVEKGISIGEAMESYPLFPPMIVQLVKVGEQTGKVDETLLRASEYYEREVDQRVKYLTTALEPIIIIVLAIGVLFIIVSIITPIYSVITEIK